MPVETPESRMTGEGGPPPVPEEEEEERPQDGPECDATETAHMREPQEATEPAREPEPAQPNRPG
ncbi:hypothetical protein ACIRYZ_44580 [Kitasatospora sp. NPDC101155]|uniref:hypothetical protein n=1 Tax=Kitasatospora sp. NPDC101155 TaxID=3364097 RepID=UPI0038284F7B